MRNEQTRGELRKGTEVLGTLTAYSWQYLWLDCDFDAIDADGDVANWLRPILGA